VGVWVQCSGLWYVFSSGLRGGRQVERLWLADVEGGGSGDAASRGL
jgi:hypothetical protein